MLAIWSGGIYFFRSLGSETTAWKNFFSLSRATCNILSFGDNCLDSAKLPSEQIHVLQSRHREVLSGDYGAGAGSRVITVCLCFRNDWLRNAFSRLRARLVRQKHRKWRELRCNFSRHHQSYFLILIKNIYNTDI